MNIACGQVFDVFGGTLHHRLARPSTLVARRRAKVREDLPRCIRIVQIGPRSVIGPARLRKIDLTSASIIDLYAGGLALHSLEVEDALAAIECGYWKAVTGDPIQIPFETELDIPADKRAAYLSSKQHRERAIRPLLALGANAFESACRLPAITEATSSTRNPTTGLPVSHAFVRNTFALLLKAGGNPSALFARHVLAGNLSLRERTEQQLPLPKNRPGPKRRLARLARDAGSTMWMRSDGCALTPEIFQALKKGIEKYLFTSTAKTKSGTIRLPWTSALKSIRADPQLLAKVSWAKDPDGQKVRKVWKLPKGCSPSIDQLKTVAKSDPDIWKQIERIKGETDAARNNRPLTSDVRSVAFGPGSRYELDWTVADVWVVSDIDSLPCGRPNVCFVRDAFSRLIVAIYATTEDSDYRESAVAIYLAFSSKRDFAARWGVTITDEDWPAVGTCDELAADNGELLNKLSGVIPHNLADLQFAPAGRADLKGIVESGPRLMNLGVLRFLTGSVAMKRAREEKQPKDAATIPFSVLMRELIHWVVSCQNRRARPRMRLDADFRSSGLSPTPMNLWRWGISNRTGQLPQKPQRELIAKLLPEAEARIDRRGLWYRGVCFDRPDDAAFQNLKVRAGLSGSIPCPISFDRQNTNFVFKKPDSGLTDYLVVPISAHTIEFRDKTFDQVERHLQELSLRCEISNLGVDRSELDQYSRITSAIKESNDHIRDRFGSIKKRNETAHTEGVKASKDRQTEHLHTIEREHFAKIVENDRPLDPPASQPEPTPESFSAAKQPASRIPRWTMRVRNRISTTQASPGEQATS